MMGFRHNFLRLALGSALLILPAAGLSAAKTDGPTGAERNDIRSIARSEVISRNIAPAAIRSITINPRVQSSQGGGRIIGYNAWVRIESCDRGYVVVQMTRRGTVQQTYGYDGCHPPGL